MGVRAAGSSSRRLGLTLTLTLALALTLTLALALTLILTLTLNPNPNPEQFKPDFPASSPYVTAVGGTDFDQKSVVGTEKAWSNSGGGFSNTFGIPAYQAKAVKHYKRTATLPPARLYNDTGRGYPDVSALGG